MTAEDHTCYGSRDGHLLFIAEVPRGLACNCLCVRCGLRLVAKKGTQRRHHFAHYETANCVGAAESALHILAKELLQGLDEFTVPKYDFVKRRTTKTGVLFEHHATIAKGGNIRIDRVSVENHEGDFIPDIVVESGSKSLIVEVAVTHKVTREKLRKIRRRDLPAIEIRLGPTDALLPRESLRSKLQHDSDSKTWLFHPRQRHAECGFASMFRAALARGRQNIRQSGQSSIPRRVPSHLRLALLPPSQIHRSEFDRVGDDFARANGRYPTLDECRAIWPHLFETHQ